MSKRLEVFSTGTDDVFLKYLNTDPFQKVDMFTHSGLDEVQLIVVDDSMRRKVVRIGKDKFIDFAKRLIELEEKPA